MNRVTKLSNMVSLKAVRTGTLAVALTGLALLAGGCAGTASAQSASGHESVYAVAPTQQAQTYPAPNAASALVFDAPVTAYAPPLNFDRSQRATVAYLGYESTITTTYTRLDDRQSYDSFGRGGGRGRHGNTDSSYVDRQSVTQSVTVRER